MAIGGAFTERLLRDAGLAAGMRVLDIGCGSGDVSFIAADIVGPSGSVVGIDRQEAALDVARERAMDLGRDTVEFVCCDVGQPPEGLGLFDAIVGRRVLMYIPDPVATVRGLVRHLRPGGLLALHEHDATMVPASVRDMPLHRTVQGWLREMIRREGADTAMGFNLYGTLTEAGLTVEQVRAEAVVQTPAQEYPLGEIVRMVLARIVDQGIASEAEVDIDTLDARLDEERIGTGATYVGDMMFGASARKPG